MTVTETNKIEISEIGFTTVDNIYSDKEIDQIFMKIDQADKTKETFRKSAELFAIRQFLKEIPDIKNLVFNGKLKTVVRKIFGDNYFVVKSIYFDKPETSNWYVDYHQDLTILVDKKVEIESFGPWTTKQNQFAVQPSIDILENIFTVRIYLDDTDENNGALRVIPKSHLKKIYKPETSDWSTKKKRLVTLEKVE
jgi:ectoine hydroxylase-related dioxygenase (phytanoyl-CoA dioxygenase family)